MNNEKFLNNYKKQIKVLMNKESDETKYFVIDKLIDKKNEIFSIDENANLETALPSPIDFISSIVYNKKVNLKNYLLLNIINILLTMAIFVTAILAIVASVYTLINTNFSNSSFNTTSIYLAIIIGISNIVFICLGVKIILHIINEYKKMKRMGK